MKIFSEVEAFDSKVNFIDKENVLVGYDLSQSCCEVAGYFISDKEWAEVIPQKDSIETGLEDYVFDRGYFVEVEDTSQLDCGGMVRFRLVARGKPSLYLHLYNIHNGYYSHGFKYSQGKTVFKEGHL